MASAARELFSELIDFAALFPPAAQPMNAAVESFATHRASAQSFMLSRFVCPASRLEEFAAAARKLWDAAPDAPAARPTHEKPKNRSLGNQDAGQADARRSGGGHNDDPLHESNEGADEANDADGSRVWAVSAILDGDMGQGLDAVARFNRAWAHPPRACAVVDSVEVKAARPQDVDAIVEGLPDQVMAYVEIPLEQDPRSYAAALAGSGVGAKLRTGGVTPAAVPTPDRVAEAIVALGAAGVAFKATAGLHHPIRAEQNLTYETGCARAVMHGFVNVFFAACAVHARQTDAAGVTEILSEPDPRAFTFSGSGASWRRIRVSTQRIAAARDTFCHSFGSCSFEEPVADLKALRWL